MLSALFGVSLLWSISVTDRNPAAAYFSTPARAWELALGAICAVTVPFVSRLPGWARAAMAWVGLAGVVWAIVHYTAQTAFPGKAALLPVVGTALMIAGGSGSITPGPQWLLRRAGFQRIGDWSYSIYLWHWPFLIVGAAYLQRPLTRNESIGLVLAAVALSALTYRFVECPFRTRRSLWSRPRVGISLYPAGVAVTLLACLVATNQIQRQIDGASKAPPITVNKYVKHQPPGSGVHQPDRTVLLVQASVKAAQQHAAIPGQLTPPLLSLATDIADVGACDYQKHIRVLCPRGDVASSRTIVLFGDSHARSWIPAVEKIAEREHFKAYFLVKPGCNAAETIPDYGHGGYSDCVDWRNWAFDQITRMRPDVLLLSNDMPPGIVGPGGGMVSDLPTLASSFQAGLEKTMADLRPYVGRTVVFGDVPGVDDPPALCLSERGANLGDCAFHRSRRSKLLFEAAKAAAADGGYQFVSPLPWFCADGLCPSVVGSTVTYRDRSHITTEYAAELTRPLEAALHLWTPN